MRLWSINNDEKLEKFEVIRILDKVNKDIRFGELVLGRGLNIDGGIDHVGWETKQREREREREREILGKVRIRGCSPCQAGISDEIVRQLK